MTSTTYTVLNRHGSVQERGCSLSLAAEIVLGYDGHEYEIRQATGGGWNLWTSRFSRNSTAYNGLVQSTIYSPKPDRDDAEIDICKRVIGHADWFENCQVMTDADYDAMQAEFEAENRLASEGQ